MSCSTHVQLDTHGKRKSSKSQKVGCYTHFEFYQPAKSVVIPPADMARWHPTVPTLCFTLLKGILYA